MQKLYKSGAVYAQETYRQAHTLLGMTPKKIKAIRLNAHEERLLSKLSKKLGVDTTNVIRIAIHRLAEAEGVK